MILTFLTKEPNPSPQSTNFLILKSFKLIVLRTVILSSYEFLLKMSFTPTDLDNIDCGL